MNHNTNEDDFRRQNDTQSGGTSPQGTMNKEKLKEEFKERYKAVKNRLCRIEDDIAKVWVDSKMPDTEKQKLMVACIDIDKCVESLEKLIKTLPTKL
jgi:hypothetical protein